MSGTCDCQHDTKPICICAQTPTITHLTRERKKVAPTPPTPPSPPRTIDIIIMNMSPPINDDYDSSLFFDGVEYKDGDVLITYDGVHTIAFGKGTGNNSFGLWQPDTLISINNWFVSPSTCIISGDGSFFMGTLIGATCRLQVIVKDKATGVIDTQTGVLLDNAWEYHNGDVFAYQQGTFALTYESDTGFTWFDSWIDDEPNVTISDLSSPIPTVALTGDGTITLYTNPAVFVNLVILDQASGLPDTETLIDTVLGGCSTGSVICFPVGVPQSISFDPWLSTRAFVSWVADPPHISVANLSDPSTTCTVSSAGTLTMYTSNGT